MGHIGPTLSSAFGAAPLRFAPPDDNAGPMRLFGFPRLLLTKADKRVGFAQQNLWMA
jgi:hypothetical protein